MKISKISFRLAAILFVSTILFACKKKGTDVPANEITDATELETSLTWSLTDGTSATAFVDLDLYLVKGNITQESQLTTAELVDLSDNSANFETASFLSTIADGDYTIVIDYFDLQKPGKYTLTFKGKASGKIYAVADIAFTVSEDGSVKFPVKITKAGQKFTITKR